jgi:hypothetical protein
LASDVSLDACVGNQFDDAGYIYGKVPQSF